MIQMIGEGTMSKIEEVMTDIKNWMVKKLKLSDNKTERVLFGTENTEKQVNPIGFEAP